ncbi:MAG: LysR family transcriptional regulator [Acidobacteria bacterium]|nr:LysR family transcriptional regulator [Acidobacteriota bacterium]MCB9396299.1 LysR family transcriptional regulator [Acidobacteriota bacterium]
MVGVDQVVAHLYPFWLVAETGSFTRAGEMLGLTQSAVSYQVKILESKLDRPLLIRLPRNRFKLSSEGEQLAEHLQGMFGNLKAILDGLDNPNIGGTLRVAAPVVFGSSIITPFLASFAKSVPELEVELVLLDGFIDFFGQNLDVGFCFGVKKDRYQGARRCFGSRIVLVSSQDYLDQAPPIKDFKDLGQHEVVINPDWRLFEQLPINPMAIQPKRWRVFNNTYAMIEALRCGMGVSFLPAYSVARDLAEGRLVQILNPLTDGFNIQTYCVGPEGSMASANARAFLDAFIQYARQRYDQSFVFGGA